MNKLIYRYKGGSLLAEVMQNARLFNSKEELINHITETEGVPSENIFFEDCGYDKRIGWKKVMSVTIKRNDCESEVYRGFMCYAKDIDRSKPWSANSWSGVNPYRDSSPKRAKESKEEKNWIES